MFAGHVYIWIQRWTSIDRVDVGTMAKAPWSRRVRSSILHWVCTASRDPEQNQGNKVSKKQLHNKMMTTVCCLICADLSITESLRRANLTNSLSNKTLEHKTNIQTANCERPTLLCLGRWPTKHVCPSFWQTKSWLRSCDFVRFGQSSLVQWLWCLYLVVRSTDFQRKLMKLDDEHREQMIQAFRDGK